MATCVTLVSSATGIGSWEIVSNPGNSWDVVAQYANTPVNVLCASPSIIVAGMWPQDIDHAGWPTLMASTDGVHFSLATSDPFTGLSAWSSGDGTPFSLAYSPALNLFMVAGSGPLQNSFAGPPLLATSTDGLTWTVLPSSSYPQYVDVASLVWFEGANAFVIGVTGVPPGVTVSGPYLSADGTSWAPATSPGSMSVAAPTGYSASIALVIQSPTTLVAWRQGGPLSPDAGGNYIYSSADGNGWTNLTSFTVDIGGVVSPVTAGFLVNLGVGVWDATTSSWMKWVSNGPLPWWIWTSANFVNWTQQSQGPSNNANVNVIGGVNNSWVTGELEDLVALEYSDNNGLSAVESPSPFDGGVQYGQLYEGRIYGACLFGNTFFFGGWGPEIIVPGRWVVGLVAF